MLQTDALVRVGDALPATSQTGCSAAVLQVSSGLVTDIVGNRGSKMTDQASKTGVSRRTLTKGAAWAVPAIAVMAPAANAAVSGGSVVIDIGKGCANTGTTTKGCGTGKSLQVRLTLNNPGPGDFVFQITSMFTANGTTTPPTSATGGAKAGISGLYKTNVPGSFANQGGGHCTLAPTPTSCSASLGGNNASILVPAGTQNATYWIVSPALGTASDFATTINWQTVPVNGTTCGTPTPGSDSGAFYATPSNNCN